MKIVLGLLDIVLGVIDIMMFDTRYSLVAGVFCMIVGVNLLMKEGQ